MKLIIHAQITASMMAVFIGQLIDLANNEYDHGLRT